MNPILNTDSYKASHYLQYPPGTERVFSYIEARGISKAASFAPSDGQLFFGLQSFIKNYLMKPVTLKEIYQAGDVLKAHGLPFNVEGWEHIVREHGGLMPVEIQAIPEGTFAPLSTALVTVVNTDSKVPWITSYLETALLRAVWYPTTVATNSFLIKRDIKASLLRSGGSLDGLPFKLHDFGSRGVSSNESAALGGMGHLVNFMGTDTLSAVVAAQEDYFEPMAGFSIPAAEHSTITSWGRNDEVGAYANMIQKFGGEGKIFAVVSDSYDIHNACKNLWGGQLKQQVKENGGTLVVRPDSGDPATVVVQVLMALAAAFSEDVTEVAGAGDKYMLLPPYLRVIQGDGINRQSIQKILERVESNGFSADNLAFGMGGALLQEVTRDSLKFAMKCSAIRQNGVWLDVYKDPITDPGKVSKRGLLDTIDYGGSISTVRQTQVKDRLSIMRTVYKNGAQMNQDTLTNIRQRANKAL